MKKILIAAIGLMVLSACNNVNGTLTVTSGSTLQLKDKKGNVVTMNSGDASVQINKKKIVLKGMTSTGKTDTVELDGVNLPDYDQTGSHTWMATDSGQPVDIYEVDNDTYSRSPDYNGFQSCSKSFTTYEPCPPPKPAKPDPGKPDPGKQDPGRPHAFFKVAPSTRKPAEQGCPVTRVFAGHQGIVFHYDGDGYEVQLLMKDPKSQAEVGAFLGYAYSSQRVITGWSDCILDR